ncbi:MAG: SpoIIE family protein phosphatase [Ignavibacterium sp.]|nr:SpoIIE family protein phosphatase [Ignavibacterium sp.]
MPDNEYIKFKRNLSALVEFSRVINSSLDLNFILNNVLLTCLGKFLATKGFIALNENGKLVLKSSKGIPEESLKGFPEIVIDENCDFKESLKSFLEHSNLKVVEKISSSNECVGIVSLGEKLNGSEYSEDDQEFLRTLLNISASAIQNSIVINELKVVNRVLDSRVQRLNSLFELSKEFGLFNESSKVTRLLVFSLMGQFLVSKYALIKFEDDNIQVLESKFHNHHLLEKIKKTDYKNIDSSITEELIKKDFPELFELDVNLIVPMQLQGKTKGLILLGKRMNQQNYTEADIEFVYSVGSLAIISLENKRLFQEALEKYKLEEELDFARDIQKNLLPRSIPVLESFDIAALNISSRQVGGDYYDIIKLDEDSYCLAIADVSGKGIPASLLMANIQAFLRVICIQQMDLEESTELINDLISQNTSDGRFITFCWGVLNQQNKTLRYVNAGHNPPILVREGKIKKLTTGGIILGVMKTVIPYESEELQLQKDDVIVFFTDGISEAMNITGEEFSDERLEKIVIESTGSCSKEILNKIRNEVVDFVSGAVQSDDLTMIVVKVK